jgi:hypothetical protein
MSVLVFTKPALKAGEFSINIVISREKLTIPTLPEEYAKQKLGNLQKELHNFKLIREEPLVLDNQNAFLRIFNWQTQEHKIKQIQVYIIKGNLALTITASATTENFELYKDTFFEIIKSFRFK